MTARDPHEPGRSATPLELLFDLCFVVAVAQAAASLHHSLSEGHGGEGIVGFAVVFFAIWWAWMGFTWLASAFDTDDPLYRVKVFVQMAGVLVLAAGVPRAFESGDFLLITLGYAILRVGLVAQWLRAARAEPSVRPTAHRYAAGISFAQLGWIALLAAPAELWIVGWMVLAPIELFIPWWAERAGRTPWHPHHIAERYGLFTIIVIGESVLAATLAIQSALDLGEVPAELVAVIVGAPVILFTLWWLYFAWPAQKLLSSDHMALVWVWGYGHYLIFAAAAAVGAGLAVLVDHASGKAHLSAFWAGQALAVPVAAYLTSVWLVHARHRSTRLETLAFPLVAVLVLLAPLTGHTVLIVAALLVLLTAATVRTSRREREG